LSATLKNKHLAGAPVAGIALAIALLAAMLLVLFPGRAEAQEQEEEQAANNAETTTTVQPGDSLWTMAQARLAPDPAPQRVALEVERIYALNQDRIGPDPGMILAGQELLVPPVTEPATGEVVATPQPASLQPAPPEPTTAQPEEIPASAATPVEEPPAPTAELPVLPEVESSFTIREIVPQASTSISPFSNLGDNERRRILGVGIILLTLVLALLMAWRLPLSRSVGESSSWGSYGRAYGAGRAYDDYFSNYALSEQPGKDLSERDGTSVGPESASPEAPPEETFEEKTPESADQRVDGASGTTGAREAEDAPGVPQREHLRLMEETPTEGQEQQRQRRAGGGR
jgi:hypothetical protein